MPVIRNILFPIDFSERTCGAAPFVAALMNRFSAKATLLHVIEPITYAGYSVEAPMLVDLDALQRDAQTCLEHSFLKEFENLPVRRVVEIGEPAGTITRFAESDGSDLIMMPTHGRGTFRSLLLGSVASKVLNDATCPVCTAAHTEEAPLREHTACRSILCAVDGSDKSASILRWAGEFAKDAGASLRVLHVIPGPREWMGQTLDQDIQMDLREHARMTIERLSASAGLDVPICIGVGDVGPTIRKETQGHGVDALVIGRGALHESMGRLRAHSYQIIRTAPCPVISV